MFPPSVEFPRQPAFWIDRFRGRKSTPARPVCAAIDLGGHAAAGERMARRHAGSAFIFSPHRSSATSIGCPEPGGGVEKYPVDRAAAEASPACSQVMIKISPALSLRTDAKIIQFNQRRPEPSENPGSALKFMSFQFISSVRAAAGHFSFCRTACGS